jgi:ribonucleoside-triphosphate reductase
LRKTVKKLIENVLKCSVKEKEDTRYNTHYFYVYSTDIARTFYDAGFKKYGRLPQVIFNSPPTVIKAFLKYFFLGDGYERNKEIHLNDKELARDLAILFAILGMPVCYKEKKKSQRIYIQHKKSKINSIGNLATPTLFERVPGWMAKSTYVVPGLNKGRMVGVETLSKYDAHTNESKRFINGDIMFVRVEKCGLIELEKEQEFFDVELEKNHLFIHSLGNITHNCCHLRLDKRELKKRGGGLFGANPLTGSIGVVTINMPRIGYLSKSEGEFFERLDKMMVLAKDVLEIKRKWLEKFTEAGLYPYSRFYLRRIKEAFGSYWKNHFNTIGLIGMNEACLNFLGCTIGDPEGLNFSIRVLDFMRKRLQDFQEETGSIFNLEATPAEGTSHRLAKIDKKKYPDIIVANEEDAKNGAAPYYTNSTNLPVFYTDDLWEYLRLQDPLQTRYTGGTVVHVWLGESNPPVESVAVLVRKICENFKLPYFTLTPTFSICPEDGYLSGEQPECPKCGRNTEIYSRVVGYLRPVDQWNAGKQEEFKQRKVFDRAIGRKKVEIVG